MISSLSQSHIYILCLIVSTGVSLIVCGGERPEMCYASWRSKGRSAKMEKNEKDDSALLTNFFSKRR
jgi:hypothetical protein